MNERKSSFLLACALVAVALIGTGCLSVTYKQESDRLNQTESTRVAARGLFKDTALDGVLGATVISVTDTNGGTYDSARNLGATNLSTIVSTNAASVLESAGSATGNVIGAAVKP